MELKRKKTNVFWYSENKIWQWSIASSINLFFLKIDIFVCVKYVLHLSSMYTNNYLFCPQRYILASGGCTSVIGCRVDDIIYSPLPQYHSVAGMISLAGTMGFGISMVMRTKFSASSYWADVVKYKATVSVLKFSNFIFIYIHVYFLNIFYRLLNILVKYADTYWTRKNVQKKNNTE